MDCVKEDMTRKAVSSELMRHRGEQRKKMPMIYNFIRKIRLRMSAVDMIRDLQTINEWSNRFELSVNPTKYQAIVVGSHRLMTRLDIGTLPAIIFNGTLIPVCRSVKDLGLHIDCTFNWRWRKQVANQCQKVTGTLRVLNRLKNF